MTKLRETLELIRDQAEKGILALSMVACATAQAGDNKWPTGAINCMAANIYHEARGEPLVGQLLVAQVTLNRVASKHYPNTICGVVKQRHQFSWYWDGKPDYPLADKKAWNQAMKIAMHFVINDKPMPFDLSEGATHYFAPDKVATPKWANAMTAVGVVGDHVFLRHYNF